MDDLELAYVHDGSLEGLLTAVFLAFERKEYPSDVSASCRFMPRLGQRIVEVETNMERAWRVRAGIIRVCDMETYQCVVAASLSDEPDAGSSILSFVRYAMKRGPRARFDKAAPDVGRFAEIVRSIRNERHYWVQFMRFSKTRDGVYVAVCNPKASVVPLLMGWFSARFNTQPFIVFDEVHHVAGVSHNGEWQHSPWCWPRKACTALLSMMPSMGRLGKRSTTALQSMRATTPSCVAALCRSASGRTSSN